VCVHVCVCVCVLWMLYISYHVHWSEINVCNPSGFQSCIAEVPVFWDVTPFRQK